MSGTSCEEKIQPISHTHTLTPAATEHHSLSSSTPWPPMADCPGGGHSSMKGTDMSTRARTTEPCRQDQTWQSLYLTNSSCYYCVCICLVCGYVPQPRKSRTSSVEPFLQSTFTWIPGVKLRLSVRLEQQARLPCGPSHHHRSPVLGAMLSSRSRDERNSLSTWGTGATFASRSLSRRWE